MPAYREEKDNGKTVIVSTTIQNYTVSETTR